MRAYSFIFVGIIVLLVGGAMFMLLTKTPYPQMPTVTPPAAPITNDAPITPPLPAQEEATSTSEAAPKVMITVETPLPSTQVKSPLEIKGLARGNWYFEASFPVRLVDAGGQVIAQTPAHAEGDWMTENFVPFTATLTWGTTTSSSTTGTLIFKRDNPSGLPENDAEIHIPVIF